MKLFCYGCEKRLSPEEACIIVLRDHQLRLRRLPCFLCEPCREALKEELCEAPLTVFALTRETAV